MLILYARPGLEGISQVLPAAEAPMRRDHLVADATRLLRTRRERMAAELLASAPFEIRRATDSYAETVPALYAIWA